MVSNQILDKRLATGCARMYYPRIYQFLVSLLSPSHPLASSLWQVTTSFWRPPPAGSYSTAPQPFIAPPAPRQSGRGAPTNGRHNSKYWPSASISICHSLFPGKLRNGYKRPASEDSNQISPIPLTRCVNTIEREKVRARETERETERERRR